MKRPSGGAAATLTSAHLTNSRRNMPLWINVGARTVVLSTSRLSADDTGTSVSTARQPGAPPRAKNKMSIKVVRLGTRRLPGEGIRLGTVRRPPRGVPKSEFATQNWYDVWFPNLAPSAATMRLGLGAKSESDWAAFVRRYKVEMAAPHAKHDIHLLAALSRSINFSLGCYCENESRCHRSILKELLIQSGADVA